MLRENLGFEEVVVKNYYKLEVEKMNNVSKENVEKMKKLFDLLGDYGGRIEFGDSENEALIVQVEEIQGATMDFAIGIVNENYYERVVSPLFHLSALMDGGEISSIEVLDCETRSIEVDMIWGDGNRTEKNCNLQKEFEAFMENVVKIELFKAHPERIKQYAYTAEEINSIFEAIFFGEFSDFAEYGEED